MAGFSVYGNGRNPAGAAKDEFGPVWAPKGTLVVANDSSVSYDPDAFPATYGWSRTLTEKDSVIGKPGGPLDGAFYIWPSAAPGGRAYWRLPAYAVNANGKQWAYSVQSSRDNHPLTMTQAEVDKLYPAEAPVAPVGPVEPPPADVAPRHDAANAHVFVRWFAVLIRAWADLRGLPAAPKPTGNDVTDFGNYVDYQEALAKHALSTQMIDGITRLIERAVGMGWKVKAPTPELIDRVRPFLRSGFDVLLSLRALPPKPAITANMQTNLQNIVIYTTKLAQFGESADFGDTFGEVAELLLEDGSQFRASAARMLHA